MFVIIFTVWLERVEKPWKLCYIKLYKQIRRGGGAEVTDKMRDRRGRVMVGIAVMIILGAALARVAAREGICPTLMGLIRTMLYITLYLVWCVSLRRRVVQAQTRRYLTVIPLLMIFWFVVRSVKYYFVSIPDATRQLWYWYYFPMLFIPLLSLFVAMSLGRPEGYRLPKWTALLHVPATLLVLLVVTNDWHQLVFTFVGEVWSDQNGAYRYGLGYFLVFGWEIACAVAAMVMLLVKSRFSYRWKWLPPVILLGAVAYGIIYASGVSWMQVIGGDITAAECFLVAAIWESCVACGLIPTNTGYDKLFESGGLKAQIADANGAVRYASANAPALSTEVMRRAKDGPVLLDRNTLLKSAPIPGGQVLWVEDITAITALLEKLEENRESIAERNHLEMESYKTRQKISALREKNRLYDLLQEQTAHEIDRLDAILNRYDASDDALERRRLLAETAVIGAYVKRRGNLLFIRERTAVTDTAELALCLDESFANLELLGAECALDIPMKTSVRAADAMRVYDFFEAAVEAGIDTLRSVWLKARDLTDAIGICLEVECEANLGTLAEQADAAALEDGVWRFTLRVGKERETP